MKYVQQVRGNWVVRMVVPDELRDILGQRELVEIGLPNEARAREKLAISIINRFHAKIDEAREVWESMGEASKPTLSSAAKLHYKKELIWDDLSRASRSDKVTDEFLDFSRSLYATKLRLLVAGQLSDDEAEALIGYAADKLKREGQAPVGARGELLRMLAEIQLETLERAEERSKGHLKTTPSVHPLLTQPEPVPKTMAHNSVPAPGGLKLSEALTGFHKERTAGGGSLAKKTMDEHRNAVRMFCEFMGCDVALSAISEENVVAYKQALLDTPNRYNTRFPGLTLPQAIKANEKLAARHSTLAPKTINMKWLSHLSTVLRWAVKNRHLKTNPASEVRVDVGNKVHREPSYLPFTREDLKTIFGDPMFADRAAYGLNQWALLVMLYTGVRNSSEMARMQLTNIYEEQGIPTFFLAEASKNQQSKRLVPIHEDLIKLGFLDYVATLRKKKQTLLFPEWAKRPDKVNDWFNNTFLVNLGIKNKQKVFYSFRHTLATELARVGVPREISKMISGHSPQEVASIYIQATPISLMSTALNRVRFDLPILDH
jgi:integrase